ncbi:SAV_2336 N-terminal domain-related protein [Streptantibioticus ferralitis]|uniref:SAV_2336 N-terminal domain-related protein n=1 Tax=Streptantibioticus ferralitis TaxID=236510 RepID=UPI0031D99DE2
MQALKSPRPGGAEHGALAVPNAPGAAPLAPHHRSVWDLVLVVDISASMVAWYPTVDAFARKAHELSLFTDVHTVRLYSQANGGPDATVDNAAAQRANLHTPDGGGRRKVVFVITDGVGHAWSYGSLWPRLNAWGRHHTLAILHVLPHQEWTRTGVSTRRLKLRSPHPGSPNSEMAHRPEEVDATEKPAEPDEFTDREVVIPVLEMRKRWLQQWSRLVLSNLWVPHQAITVPAQYRSPTHLPHPVESGDDVDAGDRVNSFRGSVSPTAFELATLLAAAPLNRHIMQLVQAELLPESGPEELAALLTSNLLTAVNAPSDTDPHDRITFEFRPQVRQFLLAAGTSPQTLRVVKTVERYLSPHNDAVSGISQRIENRIAAESPAITYDNFPYMQVEYAVLTALSGPHGEAAKGLGARLEQYLYSNGHSAR